MRRIVLTEPGARRACVSVMRTARIGMDELVDDDGQSLHVKKLVHLKHWAWPIRSALDLDDSRITFHVLEAPDPAEALIDFARRNQVDHIVMGARGNSALRRYLGSVSSQVVARSWTAASPWCGPLCKTPALPAEHPAGAENGPALEITDTTGAPAALTSGPMRPVTSTLWDISPPVALSSPVFPGDTRYQQHWSATLSPDCPVNVASLTLSPHVGAHADAPLHYDPEGATAGQVDLHAYLGPCRVIHAIACGPLVQIAHLTHAAANLPPRVLVRVYPQMPQTQFDEALPGFAPATLDWLADQVQK